MREDITVPIRSDLDIVTAREHGRSLAAALKFSPGGATLIATAISELARNIVAYARSGEIRIQAIGGPARQGIQVVARDEGPGIADVRLALRHGFSTAGGLGLGLPGVKRLVDEFRIVSGENRGTTVVVKKWRTPEPARVDPGADSSPRRAPAECAELAAVPPSPPLDGAVVVSPARRATRERAAPVRQAEPRRPRSGGRPPGRGWEGAYARSLDEYLRGGGEDVLRGAYELARAAVAEGVGLLEMAAVHHASVAAALRRAGTRAPIEQVLQRASEFFGESLSPYEMAHRGFRDAVSALRRLNETLENEIQRMALAVHDEAGQLLVAAKLAMAGLGKDVGPAAKGCVAEVCAILDQAESELRRLAHELWPTILHDLGLVPALEVLADGIAKRAGLSIEVESSLRGRPGRSIETTVYRVVQEALTNVARHARATTASVQLGSDANHLHCAIRDDGVGFDAGALPSSPARGGLGLVGMRERLNAIGGTMKVRSEPGRGTELRIRVPLET